MHIVVESVNATSVYAGLNRLERALTGGGLADFFATTAAPYLAVRAQNRFSQEGDDAVGAWAPLRQFTQNIRASQGYGPAHPINKRTGELESYIVGSPPAIVSGTDGGIMRFPGPASSGKLAEKVRTAQIGFDGGKSSPSTVPRPVLGISVTDLEALLIGLAKHIESY